MKILHMECSPHIWYVFPMLQILLDTSVLRDCIGYISYNPGKLGLKYRVTTILFFYVLILRETERGGGQRERGSQAGFFADSMAPNTGLDPMNHEITT